MNEAIDTWNNTFGRACDLEYSQRLRTVLLRLSCVAELQLPGLRIDDEDTEVGYFHLLPAPIYANENSGRIEPLQLH